MKIGIIGSGNIGGNLGKLLAKKGHSVLFSSRHPETLGDLAKEAGHGAKTGTIEEAAKFGELVIVSIPLGHYKSLPVEPLVGKIVIDTNNYYPERDGHIADLDSDTTTSSELLQHHLPASKIVKAFNTIWFEHLKTQGDVNLPEEKRRAIFVAGDDEEAKQTVIGLIHQLGFGIVDRGDLAGGRNQQPGTEIYNKTLTAEEAWLGGGN